ncbi:hypothetical protein [Pyrobaculum islandicum]|uniref:hypothetical protein n=1 Tax=Pyrobaculum islandicum TaxID=2277 RepID=UPI00069DE155|nr:hypothetical protein [Pyrobaculum islandicum]
MGAGQKFHKTDPRVVVERRVSAMLLTFAATRTTVVISNVLIPAGVIHMPPLALFIPVPIIAMLAALAVKPSQTRFSTHPHL